MTKFFKVVFASSKRLGVAVAVKEADIFLLPDSGLVPAWQELELELRDGDFPDYLSSDLGCRMCSERLRKVLHEMASPNDHLQWLPVVVRHGEEKRKYWILHFPTPPDVIDRQATLFAGDFVVKPALTGAAAACHHVFSYPGAGDCELIVCETVKRAIEAGKFTGMELSSVKTS